MKTTRAHSGPGNRVRLKPRPVVDIDHGDHLERENVAHRMATAPPSHRGVSQPGLLEKVRVARKDP